MPVSNKRLAEIDAIPDAKIDTSDIPEMDKTFFVTAKLNEPHHAEYTKDELRVKVSQ